MAKTHIKTGETLIEVIAALTSLALAGLAAVTVILSVMNTTAISKEYLVAQNLAREGVESAINIRDTNWLRFPSEKNDCWMIVEEPAGCPAADKKADEAQKYILKRNAANKIYLESVPSSLDLADGIDQDFELKLNDSNIYEHNPDVPADTQPFPTFYRMIKFEKVEVADLPADFENERMKIVVTVEWMNKSTPKKYELSSIITNYEK